MGAPKYQHSKYSIWTNYAYLGSALILFALLGEVILPVAIALTTLFAGSYWYHSIGNRDAVVFDYFGMYLTMLSVAAYNLILVNSGLFVMMWFLILLIMGGLTLALKSSKGLEIVGVVFTLTVSTVWMAHGLEQFLAAIFAFAVAFAFRTIGVKFYPKHEDSFHAVWHVVSAIAFIFMVV